MIARPSTPVPTLDARQRLPHCWVCKERMREPAAVHASSGATRSPMEESVQASLRCPCRRLPNMAGGQNLGATVIGAGRSDYIQVDFQTFGRATSVGVNR